MLIIHAAEVTEDSADAYWRLEQDSTVKYFSSLDDAVHAITANDATITLLKNSTETAPCLDVAYAYTVNGGSKTLTLTPFTYGTAANSALLYIANGNIAFKNLTLAAASKPSAQIYIQNNNGEDAAAAKKLALTFENFVCNITASYGVILNQPASITVLGSSCKFTGSTNDVFTVQATAPYSTITLHGGTFIANAVSVRLQAMGAHTTINGGSFETTNKFVYIQEGPTSDARSSATINGGLFTFTGTKTTRLLFDIKCAHGDITFSKGSTAIVRADIAQSVFSTPSSNYTLTVEGGTFVMGTQTHLLNASNAVLTGATILFNAVDGNNQFTVTSTKKITLTDDTPKIKFGGTLYNLYMVTPTNADTNIVTDDNTGASIYLGGTETTSGIRFSSHLSESIIAAAKAALDAQKTVSYGTLIAPADYVAAAGAFTKSALDAKFGSTNGIKGDKNIYADVPAVNSLRDENSDGVFESFSAVLMNIKEENFPRSFAAVAYVVIDGEIFYSAYNTADNARSIKQIAAALIAQGIYANDDTITALLNKYTNASGEKAFDPTRTSVSVDKLDASGDYTILFIGNSYTKSNDLAGIVFPAIAESAGYNFTVVKAVRDSWYLIQSADPTDINGTKVDTALKDHDIDYMVMQEQSTCSILNPGKFYDGSRALNELAKAEGATPIFYCTWGRKEGHSFLKNNDLTTETMMWKIAAAYSAIGEELGIDISNVGMAFCDVYYNNPSINLYNDDLHHPSYAGTYLAAMTIFARITGVDPTTIPFNGDGALTASDAAILKEAARKAVFEPAVIPEEYHTSSVGVFEEKHVDYTDMSNVTTLPSSSIITITQNGDSYSGITGTKGEVASTAHSTTGLTDAQKADIADIGYGISVIGVEKTTVEGAIGHLIDGYWASGTNSAKFEFDSNKYNINGELDERGLFTCLITLNFGSKHSFDAIGFCSGDMKGFAGAAEVYVSDDGINWTRVPTACWDRIYGNAYSGCSSNPTDFTGGTSSGKTCLFSMEGFSGQYIRMGINIGRNDAPEYYNTISTRELIVYGEKLA